MLRFFGEAQLVEVSHVERDHGFTIYRLRLITPLAKEVAHWPKAGEPFEDYLVSFIPTNPNFTPIALGSILNVSGVIRTEVRRTTNGRELRYHNLDLDYIEVKGQQPIEIIPSQHVQAWGSNKEGKPNV